MSKFKFLVTQEIWDDDASEAGEADELVDFSESDLCFALNDVCFKHPGPDSIVADWPEIHHVMGEDRLSAVEVSNFEDRYGNRYYRTLHIPQTVSTSSAHRIARLVHLHCIGRLHGR